MIGNYILCRSHNSCQFINLSIVPPDKNSVVFVDFGFDKAGNFIVIWSVLIEKSLISACCFFILDKRDKIMIIANAFFKIGYSKNINNCQYSGKKNGNEHTSVFFIKQN